MKVKVGQEYFARDFGLVKVVDINIGSCVEASRSCVWFVTEDDGEFHVSTHDDFISHTMIL